MSIVNQDLDPTEKRQAFYTNLGPTATGVTGIVCHVPYPCVLDAGIISAFGISGSPNLALNIQRFIVGTGFTSINVAIGTSNAFSAFGTSGPFTMNLVSAQAASLLANDVVMFQTGVASSAVTGMTVEVVLRPVASFTQYFGGVV